MSILLSVILTISLFLCNYNGTYGIPLDDFYPFGEEAGDTLLERTLDGSSPLIKLDPFIFPFYGQEYDQVYVNANGLISFWASESTFVPERFPLTRLLPLIAPFWADSDTRPDEGGYIWYRNSTDADIFTSVAEIIRSNFLGVDSFDPNFMFIVTWDHIGYYPLKTDRNNTFQCVMVTDGEISFVVFLYADNLIQWLWSSDHIDNPAEVGVNAGDGIRFFRHPDSNTLKLLNITSTSNVDMPGVWVIRTDREGAPIRGCRNDKDVPLTLIPRSGNMLGGTVVIISGPCFKDRNIKVICQFDGNEVEGVVLSDSLSICTTPEMAKAGSVLFVMEYGNDKFSSTFFAISPERAYAVDLAPGGLLLAGEDERTITWSPNSILSSQLVPNPENIKVDVKLFRQEIKSSSLSQYQWIQEDTLSEQLPNNGEAKVVIPSINITCRYPIAYDQVNFGVCPIALKITVNSLPDSTDTKVAEFIPQTNVGQWSGVAFLRADDNSDMKLRETCEKWSNADVQSESRLSQLRACPPTLRLARFDPVYQQIQLVSFFSRNSRYHEDSMSLFHPDSHTCFNEAIPQSQAGQECCYNVDGNLAKGAPGGGSADAMSPRVDFNGHIRMDLAPYLVCCMGAAANCEQYFSERPGGEETGYALPIPACIYGDPHIVTLDGLKYTFNGKGEFVLIETEDGSFTMQGRMEPAKTAENQNALGTVFTAIVAIQHETNTTVQFEIRTKGVKVSVENEFINFDEIKEMKFNDVTVEDRGNATVIATFSKGTSIELKVENGIISVMLVSLPPNQKGMTRGLMGNFNGDPSDDVRPRGGTSPLPSNSSMVDIHYSFGMTWIVENEIDSWFSYNPGDSYDTFFDPFFEPVFQPDFSNNTDLEKEAKKICGDDKFCLFDIATTKRTEIGATTLIDSENFEDMLNSSEPIICDPQCVDGTCIEGNTCACSQGFTGNRCEIPIMSACDQNFCQNNGTCIKHVLTVMCVCPPGFVGFFCQEREPPFHIRLINGSPRVGQNQVIVDFTPSKPIREAKCFLTGQEHQNNCTSGHVAYKNIPAATYIFRVVAHTHTGERAVTRRIVNVIGEEGSGEDMICAINFINDGVVVQGKSVTVQFVNIGSATSYLCRLDTQVFKRCRSPMKYQNLAVGNHRIQIQPQGQGCDRMSRISAKFYINEQ